MSYRLTKGLHEVMSITGDKLLSMMDILGFERLSLLNTEIAESCDQAWIKVVKDEGADRYREVLVTKAKYESTYDFIFRNPIVLKELPKFKQQLYKHCHVYNDDKSVNKELKEFLYFLSKEIYAIEDVHVYISNDNRVKINTKLIKTSPFQEEPADKLFINRTDNNGSLFRKFLTKEEFDKEYTEPGNNEKVIEVTTEEEAEELLGKHRINEDKY